MSLHSDTLGMKGTNAMTTLGKSSPREERERAADNKKRYRGPYDRGAADAYYGRGASPHYWRGSTKVVPPEMTPDEIAEYREGFDNNDTGEKDYGIPDGRLFK